MSKNGKNGLPYDHSGEYFLAPNFQFMVVMQP